MKIVKARIKKLEEIDPSLVCCEKFKQTIKKEYESERIFEIDVDDTQKIKDLVCIFCNSIKQGTGIALHTVMKRDYHDNAVVHRVELEYIDIDEGL